MRNIHYINAGAGSGKTYTLTQTLVDLVSSDKCRPSEVILTTFTEPAAAEFRQKAYDALVKAGYFEKAAGLDSATIGTVHSVALKYVQKYWYILGLGSRMNVLDEDDKKVYISEAVARAISNEDRQVFKNFNETFTRKGYRNDDDWVKLLKEMIEKADTFGISDLKASREYSLDFVKGFFTGTDVKVDINLMIGWLKEYSLICQEGDTSGMPYKDENEKIRRCIDRPDSYSSLIDLKGMLESPKRARAKKIPGYDELLDQVCAAVQSSLLMEPLLDCIRTVFNLVERVNAEWDDYKARYGLIEFNDMEKYFIQLLDNDLVKEDIRSSVKYVFVDEFQDSNSIQIDIFKRLSDLVAESYWVGDPKQSIYGFRGSVPEVVMDITSQIRNGGEGFSYESLPYSWRSSEKIVEFDSALARILFTDPDRYPDPALAHAPSGNCTVVDDPIQHWDSGTVLSPMTLCNRIIEVLRTTDLRPRDIAILCRSNDNVAETAQMLKMFGLPVSSPETNLISKAETQLLFAILRYMLMKDDHTKVELSMLIDGTSLKEVIADKDRILADFDSGRLMEIAERVRHQGVPDIVDTIIDELDLRGLCSRWGDSMTRNANLDILQELSRNYDKHCVQLGIGSSLQGYITYVSSLEIPPKPSNFDDGIKVMTYHAAKGLEWRMVILNDLRTNPLFTNHIRNTFIYGLNIDNTDNGVFLRYVPDFRPTQVNGVPSFIMEKPRIEKAFNEYVEKCRDESRRLLYVGFTRARDYIVTLSISKDKFKWLNACGLEPAEMKSLEHDAYMPIWDTRVPRSHVMNIKVDECERYVADAKKCTWYRPAVDITEREFKYVSPSGLTVPVKSVKGDGVKISGEIPLEGAYDPQSLGICIHNFFAVCTPDTDCTAKAERLIANFGLQGVLTSPSVLDRSFKDLHAYMEKTFGAAVKEHHELSYTQKTSSGQTVIGEIDYVWELADGHCVIVDFKNSHADTDYGPQLHLYRKAMEQSGFKVDGTFLFYALQGVITEIKTSE